MTHSIDFVVQALEIGALELLPQGRKLKSGRISPYFFNSGLFLSGQDMEMLCNQYAETIVGNWEALGEPEVIFGPAYKGIPLAAGTVVSLWKQFGKNLYYAHDRKMAKKHGDSGTLVGADMSSKRVLVIDDVITTGNTKDEALQIVETAGGSITGVVIAFDRKERGETSFSAVDQFSHKHQVPVLPIADITHLMEVLQTEKVVWDEKYPGVVEKIQKYQKAYGV